MSNITPQQWWSLAPWQDMEVAPKDGTRVFFRRKNGNCCVGSFEFGEFRNRSVIILQPIAWLPLPESK